MRTDLADIALELAASSLEIDTVLQKAVSAASEGLGGAAALLFLLDGDALLLAELEHPDPRMAWEIRHRHAGGPLQLGQGPEGEVAASGDSQRSPGRMIAALQLEGQVLGVLSLSRREDFSEEDQQWLERLAGLVGLALRNARRVRRLEREVERRSRADQERLRLERQLARTDRIASLGAMAGGVAHDFNNLLVGVLGNASLAVMDLETEHPAYPAVLEIQQAAETLAGLTGKLLAFSGHGRFVSRPVPLSQWAHGEALRLSALAGRHTLVQMDLVADLPPVQADPQQLSELLFALVSNACEAGCGSVRIRTALRHQRDLQDGWLPDALKPGRYVLLEVHDDGPGMSQEVLRRAVDPFFTTKERSRGLGLSACMGIVRGHGGWMRIRSNPGLGTRITVLLPPGEAQVEVVEPRQPQGLGVLVIDDEGIVRRLAHRVLERADFAVRVAASGEAGLRALEDAPADLVVLDMTMPGLGGPATLARIRERWPGVPVLLTSGYSEQAALRRLGEHRPEGFLAKPWTGERLLTAVKRLLEAPSTA